MHAYTKVSTSPKVNSKRMIESLFNTDVLVQRRRETNDRNNTHLFSIECLNTGFTTARYVNMGNYRSNSDMVNKVATDYWIHSEYGDGFGEPLNAFFTQKGGGEDLHSLQKAGEPENLIWAKSDLKLSF